ncbi:XrtA/PEP-CTERM system exopolysaccharide export protein [Stakelama pacifica]|nr:XrtA/PEP-CTERM system exopolysaccharide export protein [Stakelama pacifica]MAW98355.1 polysaccharide export protein [Sphingomonas sp.]
MGLLHRAWKRAGPLASALFVTGCAGGTMPQLPPATHTPAAEQTDEEYQIGPLDQLQIFVWRNPELSTKVQVRPDGRITTPLVNDMPAAGKTPAQLADDMKKALSEYVENPIVSVIVENFSGTYAQRIRVVGASEKPASIPYRANMTVLDAIIAVGGMNEYAAGNRARLVRVDPDTGKQHEYHLRLDSLVRDGDISANVRLEPGDIIIIPESMF